MLAPLVIPLVVLGTALLILFNTIGMPFSGFTVAIGHVVIALPFAILTIVPRLERIPPRSKRPRETSERAGSRRSARSRCR